MHTPRQHDTPQAALRKRPLPLINTALAVSILIAGFSVVPRAHAEEGVRAVTSIATSKPGTTTAQPFTGVTKLAAASAAVASKPEAATKPATAPVVKTAPAVTPAPVVSTPTVAANAAPVVTTAAAAMPPASQPAIPSKWGNYLRPFAVDSLWNSKPVNPVFSDFVIPKSLYYPSVQEGAWSSGVFQAKATDQPMTVYGPSAGKGILNADAESYDPSVTVPRWPADVIPATGADGHADIVDEAQGIVHSFFKLKNDGGTWRAVLYAWTKIDGRGWGDPSHYFQGARAAGVPTTAGIIRKHEINDGDVMYRHALAMSLTYNALAAKPAYVFPATSADGSAATTNSGAIPEGALVMLPASFDSARISTPALKKIVETLKKYGAYIVDRNVGTPFSIYVENGSSFNLHGGKWNPKVAGELDVIRQELRQVTDAEYWVDGDGRVAPSSRNQNLMSMRGKWMLRSGDGAAEYDTWKQAVVVRPGSKKSTFVCLNNRGLAGVTWGLPEYGKSYVFKSTSTGGASVRLEIVDKKQNKMVYSSGDLTDGASAQFIWPASSYSIVLYVTAPAGNASTAAGELIASGP